MNATHLLQGSYSAIYTELAGLRSAAPNALLKVIFETSRLTDETIAAARSAMADLLNAASPDEIVFGQNMTSLTFQLMHAIGRTIEPEDEVVVTRLDHDANFAPWLTLAERGATLHQIPLRTEDVTLDQEALLAALRELDLPWAVVTSADVRLARARLGAAGIPDPPLLVSVEDVRVGKPDPEGFLIAAARLGAAPARCLVVEDAEPGVTAGRAAGMTVAGLRGIDADVAVADLGELADLLLRIR